MKTGFFSQRFTQLGKQTDYLEETLIALLLGLMTLLTFANVIFRYVLNGNILWALELTVFMFAWMVLVGASYGVKKHFHIGVDVVINLAPSGLRKNLCINLCVLLFVLFNLFTHRLLELLVSLYYRQSLVRNRRYSNARHSTVSFYLV